MNHDEIIKQIVDKSADNVDEIKRMLKTPHKRILVTGNNGFVASELFQRLKYYGHTVFGCDNMSNPWISLRTSLDLVNIGDITDPEYLKFLFNENGPFDVCYHLAAQISVDESLDETEHYIHNNLIGTARLVKEFYDKNPAGQFIFASTSEVYGSAQYRPMDIQHPTNPSSSYAVSKLAADRHLHFLMRAYSRNIKICRMFNTYGMTQGSLAFIPLAVFSALNYGKIFIFGDGFQRRDYIHVDRIVDRYVDMMTEIPGVYNFGTGVSFSINDIAYEIKEAVESLTEGTIEIVNVRERIGEVTELVSSESCFGDATDKEYQAMDDLKDCIYEIAQNYFGMMAMKDPQWRTLTKMVEKHYDKVGMDYES